LEIAREDERQTKIQLVFDIKTAFYDLWLKDQQLAVAQSSYDNLGQHYRTVLFKIAHKTLRELFSEQTRRHGFTIPQVWVIFALHKKPYQNLLELSEMLGLTKSTVSGIVNRLVIQGIVVREIPEDNRRTVKLSLSPQFIQGDNLIKLREQFFARITTTATAAEIETINAGLETLLRVIRRISEADE
jgi:DNA-binding MarR family transcriptional regulator